MPQEPTSPREAILHAAISLTVGDRDKQYGPPYRNLSDCARLFTAYIVGKFAGTTLDESTFYLTAEDIAWLNVLQKIARTYWREPKSDTYEDAAAYAAIAFECATRQEPL